MRGLFWLLALFGLAVAVALGGQLNQGYVLLVLPPWRVEVSLNLFIVIAILSFALFYAVLRALSLTFKLPVLARDYRLRRKREQAAAVFQDAVRLLFEGRFGQALKRAADAYAGGTAPGLAALVAARAAQRMGEPARQQEWLDKAQAGDRRCEAAALMLEAEMHNEARRFDLAAATLARLQLSHGRHLAAMRLELRALQGTGDWEGVLRLARQLEKRGGLADEAARRIKGQAHLEILAAHRADAGQLVSCLNRIPANEREGRIAFAAARELQILGDHREAQAIVEAALERGSEAWNDDLVELYGQLPGPDLTGRIARAEQWLVTRPGDAVLLLALGRMCERQRLWGKAQSYFEASLAVDDSRDAHLELARLMERLERDDEANRHYRLSVGEKTSE